MGIVASILWEHREYIAALHHCRNVSTLERQCEHLKRVMARHQTVRSAERLGITESFLDYVRQNG